MTTRRGELLLRRGTTEPFRRERIAPGDRLETAAPTPERRSPRPPLFQLGFSEPLPSDYYLG